MDNSVYKELKKEILKYEFLPVPVGEKFVAIPLAKLRAIFRNAEAKNKRMEAQK